MRFIAAAILACLLPLLCPARTMAIPGELKDRVITIAFDDIWGLPDKDRHQPEFALAAYDQIKLVRAAINADPATPLWMKAGNIGIISIDEAKTGVQLTFPDSLTADEIRGFYRQFLRFHAKVLVDAEARIVESLEDVIRATKASIEAEQDPIRRGLLNSVLEKARNELGMYQIL
jgi:hypothetical protein